MSPVDLNAFMPPWGTRAACASYSSRGAPWSWMFADELSERQEGTEYTWPDVKVVQAMSVCAGCPVRRECAEYAYELERAEGTEWWSGETVEQDRRFGIFGGLPGRMRERFAPLEDRIEVGERWFRAYARKERFTLVEGLDDSENLSA